MVELSKFFQWLDVEAPNPNDIAYWVLAGVVIYFGFGAIMLLGVLLGANNVYYSDFWFAPWRWIFSHLN